ncbi:hypothetical protein GGS21DRAFT_540831 [Xylaria nigripes]|nr:hypothetical protein GGS21DRAFT_540831 [Xylaria nigripes]
MKLFKSTSHVGRARLEKQQRSNLRGRISGPIPIHDDDEVPTQLLGPEVQGGAPKPSDPVTQAASAVASTNAAPNAAHEDSTNPAVQSRPSQYSTTPSPVRHRTNQSIMLINSTVRENTDRASPPGKKPTFKATIERLFGKRSKKQSNPMVPDSEAQIGLYNEHRRRSDLIAVKRDATLEVDRERSASLPVTEFNKALRSHSIGPDDYMAINSVRSSFQAGPAYKGRRGASTSRSAISSRLPNESLDMLGLSPRPASHHMIDDPESIGRAVSVDVPASHRRSRSLPQLQDVSVGQGNVRKRSDEIRFWRESYNPRLLSPDLSVFNHEDLETIGTTGTTGTIETRETTESANGTREETRQVSPPPQSFNFEPKQNKEITPTATASLEERLTALEIRNQKLERLVAQLFHVVPGIDSYTGAADRPGSIVPTAPPTPSTAMSSSAMGTSARPNTAHETKDQSSGYNVSEPSNESFEDGKTFISSSHQSSRVTRHTSTATIRGTTSLRSVPREGPSTSDQYAIMKSLLDTERAERQALEARVTKLIQIVDMLSRTTHKTDDNPSPYAHAAISTFEHDNDDEDKLDTEFGKEAVGTHSLDQSTLGKSKESQQQRAGMKI